MVAASFGSATLLQGSGSAATCGPGETDFDFLHGGERMLQVHEGRLLLFGARGAGSGFGNVTHAKCIIVDVAAKY